MPPRPALPARESSGRENDATLGEPNSRLGERHVQASSRMARVAQEATRHRCTGTEATSAVCIRRCDRARSRRRAVVTGTGALAVEPELDDRAGRRAADNPTPVRSVRQVGLPPPFRSERAVSRVRHCLCAACSSRSWAAWAAQEEDLLSFMLSSARPGVSRRRWSWTVRRGSGRRYVVRRTWWRGRGSVGSLFSCRPAGAEAAFCVRGPCSS